LWKQVIKDSKRAAGREEKKKEEKRGKARCGYDLLSCCSVTPPDAETLSRNCRVEGDASDLGHGA